MPSGPFDTVAATVDRRSPLRTLELEANPSPEPPRGGDGRHLAVLKLVVTGEEGLAVRPHDPTHGLTLSRGAWLRVLIDLNGKDRTLRMLHNRDSCVDTGHRVIEDGG